MRKTRVRAYTKRKGTHVKSHVRITSGTKHRLWHTTREQKEYEDYMRKAYSGEYVPQFGKGKRLMIKKKSAMKYMVDVSYEDRDGNRFSKLIPKNRLHPFVQKLTKSGGWIVDIS